MSDQTDYRIEFTIQRRLPGEDDFTDIGFGSSNGWDSPSEASHIVESAIQNYDWETEPGMPAPEQIKADVEAAQGW